MKKLSAALIFTLLAAGWLSASGSKEAAGAQDAKVVFNLGGIQSAEDAISKGMVQLSKLAAEKSGGTLEVRCFPASQLGNAISQIEAVSFGSQEMFIDASGFLGQFVPDKNVETYFFTFRDENHFRAYLTSDINKKLEEEFLKKKGARIISNNWIRAPRVMASKKPISGLESLAGLKMRVPEIKGYLESVSGLGAKPTQIAWGEVYLALTQGVVDACEGPRDSMYTMKFYEPTRRIILTDHLRDCLVVIINEGVWKKLSPRQQEALVAASNQAGEWYTKTVQDMVQGYFDKMKAANTEILEIDTAPFKKRMLEVVRGLEAKGQFTAGLYDAIQALK